MYNYIISLPYIGVFILMLILHFPIGSVKNSLISYSILQEGLVLFLLIFFIAFRAFVSTDWMSYYRLYNMMPPISSDFNDFYKTLKETNLEYLFLLLASICKRISPDYFFFQSILCIIDLIILFIIFKKYIINNIILGFILFFLFSGVTMEINLLRNSKAIILFLISIDYIRRKKIFQYFMLNIAGALFHVSALFYLPMYFIINKKFSKNIILFLFIIGNFIFVFSIRWIDYFLVQIVNILNNRLASITKIYLESDYYSSSYGLTFGYIERFMSFLVIYLFYEKLIKESKDNIIFLNAFFIYIFIFLYFSEFMVIPQRVPILFAFSYWILYPKIYSMLSKNKKNIFLLILLIYGSVRLLQNSTQNFRYENLLFDHSSYNERRELTVKTLKKQAELFKNQ